MLDGQKPWLNSGQGWSFSQVGQTSRSRPQGKKVWFHVKGLVTRNTHVNIKALSLLVWKLWPRLKFFKSRSNIKVKVTRSKIMVPSERSCHKEYIRTIWKPYHLWFESYGQGSSSSKVGQTSRSRSQDQKFWYHVKGFVIRNTHMKSLSLMVWKLWPRLEFLFTHHMPMRTRTRTPTPTLGLWH